MEYNYTRKNHWRNRIWNELQERVSVPPKEAVIVYLAASTDFDRSTAIKKGFRSSNLIGVDRELAAVNEVRRGGGICLHGDILDYLTRWPNDFPVSAVVADFTSGLKEEYAAGFAALHIHPAFSQAVFVVNMLRGRDAGSNKLRSIAQEFCPPGEKMNRATCLAHYSCFLAFTLARNVYETLGDAAKKKGVDQALGEFVCHLALMGGGIEGSTKLLRVLADGYRSTSGSQYFDWAIWSNPFHAEYPELQQAGLWLDASMRAIDGAPDLLTYRRKVAAARAIRTVKLHEETT